MEGYHEIYDGSFHATIPAVQRRFDVQIETPSHVISNLPTVSKNHFAGESEGVTLAAGFFQKKMEAGASVYDYLLKPWDDTEELNKIPQILAEYNELLGTRLTYSLAGKTLIRMGYRFGQSAAFSDHIVVHDAIDAKEIVASVVDHSIPVNAVKDSLRKLFITELRYEDTILSYRELGYETEWTDLANRIARQFEALGKGPVCRAIYQYLIDENDQRAPEQFIESLR